MKMIKCARCGQTFSKYELSDKNPKYCVDCFAFEEVEKDLHDQLPQDTEYFPSASHGVSRPGTGEGEDYE